MPFREIADIVMYQPMESEQAFAHYPSSLFMPFKIADAFPATIE